MNETRDLIVGVDLGRKSSQICYYDRKAAEPRSLPVRVGSGQYETPACLCRRTDRDEYCIGLEAEYFAREKGGFLLDDLYRIAGSTEKIRVAGEQKEPFELLAHFIKGMLAFTGVMDIVKNTSCLAVTMEELGPAEAENLEKACKSLGFAQGRFILLDYGESFYYYVLTQKAETWSRSVGWYSFDRNRVSFRRLTQDGSTKPILVRLTDPVDTILPEEPEERDEQFYSFVKETLGTELYSSIQINGAGFDQEWAKKSVRLLCWQRRRVYFGSNLFAAGACAAGAERFVDRKLKDYLYLGRSLVLTDVGMDMRIMGAPAYHPLIAGGKNWYECRASAELILDGTEELVFVVSSPGKAEKQKVSMALPGLPKRPNRTTRLSVELKYISREECSIVVKDLGFGEMFPSSGRVWKEIAKWPEAVSKKGE